MANVITLTGAGQLEGPIGPAVPVDYRIDVYQENGRKDGRGALEFDPSHFSGVHPGKFVLALENGAKIDVEVNRARESGDATFLIISPIPDL